MVKIFVVDEFLDKLCDLLYEFGFIEIRRASSFVSTKEGVHLLDNSVLVKESEELKAKIKEVMELLDVSPVKEGEVPVEISTGAVEELKDELGEVLSQAKGLDMRIKDNEEKINELTVRATILSAVEERGLVPASFKKSENVVAKAGVVPKEYLKDIKSFKEEGVIIEVTEEFIGNVFLFCVALKEKEGQLARFLKNVKFKEVSIDLQADSIDEGLGALELEIWRLREESAECRRKLNEIKKKYADKLAQALWIIEENENIYRAMGEFLASPRGHVVVGWVPESKIAVLEKRLGGFGPAVYVDKEPAEHLISRGLNIKDVPSYLGHKLLRPFEKLLKFYGVPAYRHIDPTVVMSVSFVVMFGMMFGDIGHGLSLVALGIVLNFFKNLRGGGRILTLCGLSGALFGFLFGSVFGREDIIKPIWFNPSGHPEKFLGLGVGFGIVMITLGIILNIIQNMKNRQVKEALFTQWGAGSVVFYWLILFTGVAIIRYHMSVPGIWLVLIFFAPLFLIVLGNLAWRREEGVADVIFTPVEIVMGLLTNTISFVRVAAFGLAHAALGACVYLVAYSMGNMAGLKESLIIEGNLGIILFEGLIVFIQALRLEFYEFFSKFFLVQGREFRPLKERG